MAAPVLIVSVSEVARRLSLPQPLDEDDRWTLEQALLDAQADLEAYLGRPITPRAYTETGLIRHLSPDEWELSNYPLVAVTDVAAEMDEDGPTGFYTVEYTAGLDGANDPDLVPLRRFVRAHAMYSTDVRALYRRLSPEASRMVTAMSVEGQSVTYSDTYAASGQPGAPGTLPTLASCDRWRLSGRRVFQRRTPRFRNVWDYWW